MTDLQQKRKERRKQTAEDFTPEIRILIFQMFLKL